MKPFSFKVLILTLIILNLSCSGYRDNLPSVYVDITLDLNKPEFYDLTIPGNYIYISGGISGIIVYHDLTGEYKAYERACPYDFNENGARVYIIDDFKGTAADTAYCGSEFSITNDGVVVKGPAQRPLRQYKTVYYPNSNMLQISSY